MRHLLQSAGVLALSLAAFAVVGPAAAQSAGTSTQPGETTTPATGGGDTVGGVVVTARKTAENVKTIPATITAVTSAQLNANGPVLGTGDLLRTIPGVRFNDLQAPNLSEISIRGSGTERATGADSGVGLFVNGAYVGSSTLGGRNFKNIDMFDLDRVEVLEGPQGALYGRDSEFGTVNIVSAKPSFDNSGYVDETYTGGLQQNRLIGVVNQEINDDLAVRLGAETIGQSKGFYFNPDSNEYYDKTQGWLARGQLRYRHGPLDVDLLVDAQDVTLPAFVSGYAIAPGTVAAVPLGFTNNRFVVPSDALNNTIQQVQRAQLIADYDLGFGTLTSTSMATHSNSLQWYGSSIDTGIEAQLQTLHEIGAYPFTQVHTGAEDGTYYEDLHLAGKALDGALNWLVGGEVLDQHDTNLVSAQGSPCTLTATSSICGGTPTTPTCTKLIPADLACPAVFPLAFGTVSNTPQSYLSEAAYTSLRYTIRKFTLSGEFRYTNDVKNATQYSTVLFTGANLKAPTSFQFSAKRPSWTITGSYVLPGDWSDMLYAKVGTGYRAGGVNNGIANAAAPNPFRDTYGDEDTISYEAGFKGNFGRDIYVTLDGYYSSTDNAITSVSDGCTLVNACKAAGTIFNINGGTVHAEGVEAEIDGRFDVLGGKLTFEASGAHQTAKFASIDGTIVGLPILGSSVAQIPLWTGSLTVDYSHPITGDVKGFIHGVDNSQSGGNQDTVTATAPLVPLSAFNDISLRTGLDYRKLEVALFVTNLTNETYRLLILQSAGITTLVRYDEPRTVGVNVTYHW